MSLKEFLGGLIAELGKGSQAPNLPKQNQQPSAKAAPEQGSAHTGEATETKASSEVSPERLSTVNRVYIDVPSFELTIDASPAGGSCAMVVIDELGQVKHTVIEQQTLYLTQSDERPQLTASELNQEIGSIYIGTRSRTNIAQNNIMLSDIVTDGDLIIGSGSVSITGADNHQLSMRVHGSDGLTPSFMKHTTTKHRVVQIHLLLPGEKNISVVTPNSNSTLSTPKFMAPEEKIAYIQTTLIPEIEEKLNEKITQKRLRAEEKIQRKREKAAQKRQEAVVKQNQHEQKALLKEAKAQEKKREALEARRLGKHSKALDKETAARDAMRDAEDHRKDGRSAYQDKLQEARDIEQEIPSIERELAQEIRELQKETQARIERYHNLLKQLQ